MSAFKILRYGYNHGYIDWWEFMIWVLWRKSSGVRIFLISTKVSVLYNSWTLNQSLLVLLKLLGCRNSWWTGEQSRSFNWLCINPEYRVQSHVCSGIMIVWCIKFLAEAYFGYYDIDKGCIVWFNVMYQSFFSYEDNGFGRFLSLMIYWICNIWIFFVKL